MRTNVNLVIQLVTVASIVLMRLLTPGLVFVFFFIVIPIGTAALIAQIVLASSAMRRGRLDLGVSAGFLLLAATGLAVAFLTPEVTDGPGGEHSPLGLVTGHEIAHAWEIAVLLLMLWLVMAIGVAARLGATPHQVPPAPAHPTRAHFVPAQPAQPYPAPAYPAPTNPAQAYVPLPPRR